jgi:ubiquitin-conjugating enzyme E2 Z
MSKQAIKRIIQKDMKSIQTHQLQDMGIYIEFNEENMLEAVAMIKGPIDSVYNHGILFFKIKFPTNYPYSPPHVSYISRGSARIHPNLYTGGARDNYLGKVCLSILGTWSGPQWTTIMDISSVLISIQSLLDTNPLDHEPGFAGKTSTTHTLYTKVVEHETYRTLFLKNCLDIPEPFLCFKDIIVDHYTSHIQGVLEDIKDKENEHITLPVYRINVDLQYEYLRSHLKI